MSTTVRSTAVFFKNIMVLSNKDLILNCRQAHIKLWGVFEAPIFTSGAVFPRALLCCAFWI